MRITAKSARGTTRWCAMVVMDFSVFFFAVSAAAATTAAGTALGAAETAADEAPEARENDETADDTAGNEGVFAITLFHTCARDIFY